MSTNPLPFSAPLRACTDRPTQKIGANSYDRTWDQSIYHGPEGRGKQRTLDLPPQWGQLSARVCHARATACSLQHTARTTCRTVVRDAARSCEHGAPASRVLGARHPKSGADWSRTDHSGRPQSKVGALSGLVCLKRPAPSLPPAKDLGTDPGGPAMPNTAAGEAARVRPSLPNPRLLTKWALP